VFEDGALVSNVTVEVDVAEQANGETLRAKGALARAGKRFLAIPSPTNAQTLAQAQLLTSECAAPR
jgi:hypothetical protein